MKLFLKILLYVFMAFIANVDVAGASIPLPNNQETTTLSFYGKALKTVARVIENDLENYCQNGNDLINYRDWAISIIGNAAKGGSKIAVQFGKTENQIYHAFRHTDALGLDRSLVQSTIQSHFKTVSSQVVAGKPFNQIIEIGGQRIQYTAFKLSDGTFNIGRIHGVK